MAKNKYSIGLLLIVIAIILLLGKLGVFAIVGKLFWPLLIMGIGALLYVSFYLRFMPSAIVVPGGILVTYSLIFLFCNLFGWGFIKYLWPGFIFGIAVGLYSLYIMDRSSSRSLLTAAILFAIVAAIFFCITLLIKMSIYLIALILVVIGLGFIFWQRPGIR